VFGGVRAGAAASETRAAAMSRERFMGRV